MLFIHTSNQLEQLSLRFASVVNNPLKNVFSTEMIVVQNAGIARYLSMQVATIGGISANTEYLFPAEFMWRLLRLVSSDIPEKSQCTPETLRFHIMEELTNHSKKYPELEHYIAGNNVHDEQLTWDLSCQLAESLDKVLFYRSEWISQWESNPVSESQKNWQARLWINCVTNKKLIHWLHLQKQFKAAIDTFDISSLPERISFFSMSSLSPGYLELIGEIAQKTDIHIYVINPCQDQYWGDISSPKARSKLILEKQNYIDVGNPLLASMGIQGRDFIDQLLNLSSEPEIIAPREYHDTNKQPTLLKQIQQDIFDLEEPTKLTQNRQKGGRCASLLQNQDNSIVLNACHTSMREVEVLHDQILDALDSDASLTPSDILVMMPDVEDYAPYIESLFTLPINARNNKQHKSLPFSIADRDPLNVHHLIEVLLKVFQLPDTQFDVESVFEILDYEAIHTSFNLNIDQVGQCRQLAKATNIRWGINAVNRAQNKYPPTDEHTWKYALDSTLLGYALGENTRTDTSKLLFKNAQSDSLGLLAYNEIEGSNTLVLSSLKQFTDVVFRISQWQQTKQPLDKWLDNLTSFIKQLFSMDHFGTDLSVLLKVIGDLSGLIELTEFQNDISFSLFSKILQANLQKIEGNEKFLGHGITFCSLVPMRSVPFKVIALMGMNDSEYPRQDKQTSFDRVAKEPRRGDRSRRDEDRYLFLESLLAARSRLIISYIGQSVNDNTDLPPSVLVSELLDVMETYTTIKADNFICKHPLQAFSPKYFEQSTSNHTALHSQMLFSYAHQYTALHNDASIAENISNDSHETAFIADPLEELENRFKTVSLEQLIQFYQSPARYFLQTRFDIKTYDENIVLPTREPFSIESFKHREIREVVMQRECGIDSDSASVTEAQQIARAKGLLPYGSIGDGLFEKEREIVEEYKEKYPNDEKLSAESFSLTLPTSSGDFTLYGSINKLKSKPNDDQQRIVEQMDSVNFRDSIPLWISHLVLNTQNEARTEFRSPDEYFFLEPVQDAKQQLISLIENYWKGLHFPLPFFPKAAYAMFRDKGTENLTKATSAWNGNEFFSGEKDKFENWLLHRDVLLRTKVDDTEQAINQEFLQLSHEICGEYFKHFTQN